MAKLRILGFGAQTRTLGGGSYKMGLISRVTTGYQPCFWTYNLISTPLLTTYEPLSRAQGSA